MPYPLAEKIGHPALFVGREEELQRFDKWLSNIPKLAAKSKAILARRKSGKTCFVQRLFNRLWSQPGEVIPFYFAFGESKIWYPTLAIDYYCTFASQYISCLERDERLVDNPLSLEDIRQYGVTHSNPVLVADVDALQHDREIRHYNLMWKRACSAPHRMASYFDQRFVVILDEFQYITKFVYHDATLQGQPDDTLAGSYHSLAESKLAPLLITGSYVGWLMAIISKYLEAGRVRPVHWSPYLTPASGLELVYRYAQYFDEAITHETAPQINELCFSDAFFISCVFDSEYPGKDLTTQQGVIETVNYEISYRKSEMSRTWGEYLHLTLEQVNDRHAKNLLLFLHKHADRYWTPAELKQQLHIEELSVSDIQKRLLVMSEADVIEQGDSSIDFRGLQDGTLHLVIRNRFEKEINEFVPDFKQEFHEKVAALTQTNRRLRGRLNELEGRVAEYLLATSFRSRQRFALSEFFQGVRDTTVLHLTQVQQRLPWLRENGKALEADVVAQSSCGRVIFVEVKKTQAKIGLAVLEEFWEKVQAYQRNHPDQQVLPAFFSTGGFTQEALTFCEAQGIGRTEHLEGYE